MAVVVPSPEASTSGQEWTRFFIELGQPSEAPDWYPSLKLLADANGVAIPSPAEPLSIGGKISTAWYPALQQLAATI